jgi:hypothetical protein
MSSNKVLLEAVAIGLGEMLQQFVFVGGTVVELYAPIATRAETRFTDDVDCIIEIASLAAYYDLEMQLRLLGFQDDMDSDAPICRKIYRGIKVDFMPTDEKILQFSNRWYKTGFLEAQDYQLSNQITIKILPVAYFMACKLEAFFSPSRKYHLDMYASHDFEDMIYLLDNCPQFITQIKKSNMDLKNYFVEKWTYLLAQKSLVYALSGILRDSENEKRILNIIKQIVKML